MQWLYWLFPMLLIVALVCSIWDFGVKTALSKSAKSFFFSELFDSLLFMPWIIVLWRAEQPHLALLGFFFLLGMWFIKLPHNIYALEGVIKLSFSWSAAFLLLNIAFKDGLGTHFLMWDLIPFSSKADLAKIAQAASLGLGIFLFYGLPPLQQGYADACENLYYRDYVRVSLVFPVVFNFCVMHAIAVWKDALPQNLLHLIVGMGLAGLIVGRLVLGVQISLQRAVAYLNQAMVLPIFILLSSVGIYQDAFVIATLVLQLLSRVFLYAGKESPQGLHFWSPKSDATEEHARVIRNILQFESILIAVWSGLLAFNGSYALAALAVLLFFTCHAVALDSKAFVVRRKS